MYKRQAIDVTFRRNHIHHSTMGIWCDWQAQGTRITQNLLHDNHAPEGSTKAEGAMMCQDIFVEVGHGPTLIDNNVMLSKAGLRIATEGVACVHNLIPVSYTHLDVYKRQIFQSGDLVNWKLICHPLHGFMGAAWAPDILKYEGKYYIYFCSGGTNWVIWSEHIDSGWSEAIDLKVGHIDPGHVVDGEGNRYLFLSENYIVPLSRDGLSVTGEMIQVLKAPEDVYKRQGGNPAQSSL